MRGMQIVLNAHLLSSQAGYRTAGIHGYIANLLANLAAAAPADWRFDTLVGHTNQASFPGMTMHRAPFDTEAPLRRILWEQLFQPFALRGCDLYHALAFVGPLAHLWPTVVTVYDLSFMHYPERLPTARRLYLQTLTRLTCQRARRVLAISHSTARDLTETLGVPPDKIDVAPCGYDPTFFRPLPAEAVAAFKQQHQLPDRFWLFVGTLEPRKNLPTLFEAYARLPKDTRLPLIIGGGKGWQYDDIFATVERLGLGDDVRFVGFIPADDLPLWYNSAETFLYPSVFEGFGLPVLEAMACGTPVIVSDASSLPEVVGSAGLCVPPQAVEDWAAALERARDDSTWRQLARQQGFIEAGRYRWEHTAAATLLSYQHAMRV